MTEPTDPPLDERIAATAETSDTSTAADLAVADEPPAPAPERVGRGALFAVPVLPIGVVAWVVVWQLGFVSAFVAFGLVALAAFLYRLGSGGRVGGRGLAVIVGLTVVTLVVAFLAGFAADLAAFLAVPFPGSIGDPVFLDNLALNLFDNPELWAEYLPTILISVGLAALGVFSVVRQLAKEARSTR
ncbi:hypothetical protein [Microbacterium ulmi]|uniref:Uncharacterized protein n=1 Tax=Microbacterium ulmi TaxID=179095 RepID=A0A7Y2LXR7_9MICO|nr:hypothetical protein [Microbacterium ulmi]NII71247.1 hypothetical protein [Microbacterium ulmi]NNH02552.1 hypothetical protein [Microbacterium ulmi]